MEAQRPRSAVTAPIGGMTAVLGPTNTGKTHYAIERMLGHPTGLIGLPLRLLAREVYQKVAARAGPEAVALITGEEKIKPAHPRYWIATVEAMPRDLETAFLAVDEIQLAADLDRGHVFTHRLLERRGRVETLLIGSGVVGPLISALAPGAPILERPRLSSLTYAGARKIARLPPRSAIVAFSAEEVYAIAEWIRRQRGGAAVVLGALSPRTRNAQIDLYQAGEVDYIVATDAIGMGLNLDVDHIAFAADTKFDGRMRRRLTRAEWGQIAGRAGRNQRDGTFGVTGRCPPLAEEEIEALQEHRFEPLDVLQWRNAALDFSTPRDLLAALDVVPNAPGLARAPIAEDQAALETLARDPDVLRQAATPADVARLWETCQIPDYRKVSPAAHAELVRTIFFSVVRRGRIPEPWFARQIAQVDREDGDIDALSQRIAQVRTWSFIANRPDWLVNPQHWQGEARRVEDKLSDALHARLAQRFVDRRTSLLRRRLRENAMLEAEITSEGEVRVEGQHIGQLRGFRFTPDPQADGEAAKALNATAQKALAAEIDARATRVSDAVDAAFTLSIDGAVRWLGEPIARIGAGDATLRPLARLLADETLSGEALEKVQRRVDLWLAQHVAKVLGALAVLETGEGLEGIARGIAFRLSEELGVVERGAIAGDVKSLSQDARAALRRQGVRFGAYHVYLPALLKPAPRALAAQLWALKHGGMDDAKGLEDVAHMAASGRTSFAAPADAPADLYRIAGFRVAGERAVRIDILERLADLIRPAIAYRPGVTPGAPPPGAADGAGFVVTVQMTSLCGCSGEAFAAILRSLGFVSETRPGPAITVALAPAAPTTPITPTAPAAGSEHAGHDAAPRDDTPAPDADPDAATDSDQNAGERQPDHVEHTAATAPEDGPSEAATPSAATREQAGTAEPPIEPSTAETPADIPSGATAAEAAPFDDTQSDATRPEQMRSEPPVAASIEPAPAHPAQDGAANAETRADQPAPDSPQTQPHPAAPPQEGDLAEHTEASAATADAPTEAASADEAGAEPAEPALIDVWSPHRPHHPRRAEPRKRAEKRPEKRAPREWLFDKPRPERPAPEPRPASAPRPAGERSDRPEPRAEGRKRFEGKFEGRRDGKKFDKRESGPRTFTSGEKRSGREPDPNSPFAKLAALKAELEKK